MIRDRTGKLAARCCALFILATSRPALAAEGEDVMDPFTRYGGLEDNKVYVSGAPDEVIDPFRGTLSLVHTDLFLPGRGGLDLRITRSYRSRIWGRAESGLTDDAMIGYKERSWMGWGWAFHMGKLRNPRAAGGSNPCGPDLPTYEAPDGTTTTFYPDDGYWQSPSGWILDLKNRSGLCGLDHVCMWTTDGRKHEFYWETPSKKGQFFYGFAPLNSNETLPVHRISDARGNAITVEYMLNTGTSGARITKITDSLGRLITFSYDATKDRVVKMTVNQNVTEYRYTQLSTSKGNQYFLTEVKPPAGPSWRYRYITSGQGAPDNKWGLDQITYPSGASITFSYQAIPFWMGYENVRVPAVIRRVQGGRAVPSATWTYSYQSTSSSSSGDVTTITRPDGRRDVYRFYGFGAVDAGSVWAVGKPISVSRADGAEVERSFWGGHAMDTSLPTPNTAPQYTPFTCNGLFRDHEILVPRLEQTQIVRDGATSTTTYANFDAFGRPGTITETGNRTRTRTLTYFTDPLVVSRQFDEPFLAEGRPRTERTCAGACILSETQYSSFGEPIRETTMGVTTHYAYDSAGDLTRVTDARGKYIGLSNRASGVPRTISMNGQHTITQTVRPEGWVTSRTDGRGNTTSFTYDAIGRLVDTIPPTSSGAVKTTNTYAADGSWVKSTTGSSSLTRTRDGLGRETDSLTAEGVRTRTTYDWRGSPIYRSYPHAGTTHVGDTMAYDPLGRLVRETHSDGTFTTIAYGAGTRTVSNERRFETTFTLDRFGHPDDTRLAAVTDARGATTQYAYNTAGSLVSINAPGSSGDRSYSYNASNALIREDNPDTGAITYGRDAVGLMVWREDPRGRTSFTYDAFRRLTTIDYPGTDDDVTITYDNAGNRVTMSSASGGRMVYVHDALNRLRKQTWTFEDRDHVTQYGIDSQGCTSSISYPTGTVLAPIECDRMNRVTVIPGFVSAATYHPAGHVATLTMDSGKTVTFSQNPRGRITRAAAPAIMDLNYRYDAVGNITGLDNPVIGSNKSMTYDQIDRLVTASGPWGQASYSYDDLGNRLHKTEGGATTRYAYDFVTGRLTSASGAEPGAYSWDAVGNLRSDGRGLTLTWDTANRLIQSSDGATYGYDGSGRRVKKVVDGVETTYHYSPAGLLLAETDEAGLPIKEYVYLGSRLVGSHEWPRSAPASPWSAMVGVTATAGGGLRKPTGTAGWNAGAVSTETIASGDGYVQFTATETTTTRIVGLGVGNASAADTDIEYGIALRSDGKFAVVEGGVQQIVAGAYATGTVFRVEVNHGQIQYLRDGSIFYTSAATPAYPLAADTSFYHVGASVGAIAVVDVAGSLPEHFWTNVRGGALATDSDLREASGTGTAWRIGAVSTGRIAAGDGHVELTATETTTGRMIGLGKTDTNQSPGDIDFAIAMLPGGELEVHESGSRVLGGATYDTDDVLRVEVAGGQVRYVKNGVVFHTSTRPPVYPLQVDTSFQSHGATIADVALVEGSSSSFWTNLVGVTAGADNRLTKTSSVTGWNAGAISRQVISGGNGSMEFRATAIKGLVAGLGRGDTDQSLADVDHGFYLAPTGTYRVYENGNQVSGDLGTYAANDLFRIDVTPTAVKYYRNGVLRKTTTKAVAYPLNIDTSFLGVNASIAAVRLTAQ